MVFIVDDDQSVRTSLTRLMRAAGYDARAFADAEAYLSEVGTQDVPAAGCVILDVHMPGMSGLDLQDIISRREPVVPVIILSASEDAGVCARALTAGAIQVLRKPCDSRVLLRAVAEALRKPPPPLQPS